MGKTVLITGVAGLLGSRLADWIVDNKKEYTVVGIDDLSGGYIENIHPKVKFLARSCNSDLSDVFSQYKPDIVYHFAAYAAEGLSPFIRKYNYTNNLVATANIINECIKNDVGRLVFTSSMAVYGNGTPPFSESDIPNPIDPYGIAKYGCELDIQVAGQQHGLDWCIIRPHNVYGIKQNIWDKYRNVLGIWMYQHMTGNPMTIYGDGNQTRAFSYIDDCLLPFWKTGTEESASKQIINVGGTKYYSINEANRILRNVVGGGEVVYLEARYEVKEAHTTWQKSVDLLCYSNETNLDVGLRKMWNWAKKQPNRPQFKWSEYELDKGIYSYWE